MELAETAVHALKPYAGKSEKLSPLSVSSRRILPASCAHCALDERLAAIGSKAWRKRRAWTCLVAMRTGQDRRLAATKQKSSAIDRELCLLAYAAAVMPCLYFVSIVSRVLSAGHAQPLPWYLFSTVVRATSDQRQ